MNALPDWRIDRSDDEPDASENGFEFACDHVAAEIEAQAETAELVRVLSNARHAMTHLMGKSVPQNVQHSLRELDALVRQMADRVDAELRDGGYDDARDAA